VTLHLIAVPVALVVILTVKGCLAPADDILFAIENSLILPLNWVTLKSNHYGDEAFEERKTGIRNTAKGAAVWAFKACPLLRAASTDTSPDCVQHSHK